MLSVQNLFPHQYKNYLFVSVGVIDSAHLQGRTPRSRRSRSRRSRTCEKYVEFAHTLGFKAEIPLRDRHARPSQQVVELCEKIRNEFPRSIFYLGQLVFENDRFYYRLLHNETAFAIQRRLQFAGLQAVVLPIRVTDAAARPRAQSLLTLPEPRGRHRCLLCRVVGEVL